MKKIINLELYPVKIYIYKGLTDKQFSLELKKDSSGMASDSFIQNMSNDNMLACVDNHLGHIVMRFRDKHPKGDIIAHESFHATKKIMELVGIGMCEESDEAWSYMVGYLFKAIYQLK